MFGPTTPIKSGRVEDGSNHILATWGIAGFIAAACALLIGLEISYIVSQRSAALEGGRKDTANLTSSLILQAEQTFRSADAILGTAGCSRNAGKGVSAGERRRRVTASPRTSMNPNALDRAHRAIHRRCDLGARIPGLQADDGVADQHTIDDADRRMT